MKELIELLLQKTQVELQKLKDSVDGQGGWSTDEAFYNGRVSVLMELLDELDKLSKKKEE